MAFRFTYTWRQSEMAQHEKYVSLLTLTNGLLCSQALMAAWQNQVPEATEWNSATINIQCHVSMYSVNKHNCVLCPAPLWKLTTSWQLTVLTAVDKNLLLVSCFQTLLMLLHMADVLSLWLCRLFHLVNMCRHCWYNEQWTSYFVSVCLKCW